MKIFGTITALVTPFAKDGSVDYDSLRNLVKTLAEGGCHALTLFGIAGEYYKLDEAEQREMMREYRLPFFRGSWICDYPDAENYLSLFYSGNLQPNGSNYTHYVNPDYDRLFEKSQTILDDSLRNACYTKLDSMLMEDAPVVVLYYDQAIRFTRKNVQGLGINPINMLQLKHAYKNDVVTMKKTF